MAVAVDVAVVGLGLVGSGALRALADAGVDVVGVGPGEPPVLAAHEGAFASHYDSGRITRHLDPVWEWALLAARAIEGYGELEARSGIAFHRPAGVVMAELDPARAAASVANAERLGVAWDRSVDDRLALPAGSEVVAEPGPAGHLDPRRMLAANLAVARSVGAEVVDAEVVSLQPRASGSWALEISDGTEVHADAVVVAGGPHTDELLAPDDRPPFAVRGETVVLATLAAAERERLAGLPSVLARLDHPTYADLYAVPPTDYPDGTIRLKLGATRHEPVPAGDAVARRAWMRGDAHRDELGELQQLLVELVPGLRVDAWETKPCLITETPSGLPYVDHLAPGLVVAAGGNGYAAKSANAIGALAAELARTGGWPDADLDAARFALPSR